MKDDWKWQEHEKDKYRWRESGRGHGHWHNGIWMRSSRSELLSLCQRPCIKVRGRFVMHTQTQ